MARRTSGFTPLAVAISTLIWVQGPQSSARVPTMPAAAMAAAGASFEWPSAGTKLKRKKVPVPASSRSCM